MRLNQKASSIRVLYEWLLWVCIRTGGQWKPINVSQGQRHLFIRAGEHCIALFNEKRWSHTRCSWGKKTFYGCHICRSWLRENFWKTELISECCCFGNCLVETRILLSHAVWLQMVWRGLRHTWIENLSSHWAQIQGAVLFKAKWDERCFYLIYRSRNLPVFCREKLLFINENKDEACFNILGSTIQLSKWWKYKCT